MDPNRGMNKMGTFIFNRLCGAAYSAADPAPKKLNNRTIYGPVVILDDGEDEVEEFVGFSMHDYDWIIGRLFFLTATHTFMPVTHVADLAHDPTYLCSSSLNVQLYPDWSPRLPLADGPSTQEWR